MIENRPLTLDEFYWLLREAPSSEKEGLITAIEKTGLEPHEFFDKYAKERFGLVSNGRPIYMGYLIQNRHGENELWTVANTNIKQQFSLFKYSKKILQVCAKKYGEIYATMEKKNIKNAQWTERLGFTKLFETNNLITFVITGID